MIARVRKADRRGPAIVPAVVHDAHTQARALLQRAQSEATRLRASAVEEGRAAGRAEAGAILIAAAATRDRMLGALEEDASAVALLAAQRIIGDELTAKPDRILAIVRPLLARLRRARQLTLRVHPDDRDALQATLPSLARDAELACAIAIETDASLTHGGCVVMSDVGTLDARLEVRLDALREALGSS